MSKPYRPVKNSVYEEPKKAVIALGVYHIAARQSVVHEVTSARTPLVGSVRQLRDVATYLISQFLENER